MQYHNNSGWNLAMAAMSCGSNVPYVAAMLVLISSENAALIERVLVGEVSILTAAREVKRLATLVAAYRAADPADHVAFAQTIAPAL
jgi:hypothetical protein